VIYFVCLLVLKLVSDLVQIMDTFNFIFFKSLLRRWCQVDLSILILILIIGVECFRLTICHLRYLNLWVQQHVLLFIHEISKDGIKLTLHLVDVVRILWFLQTIFDLSLVALHLPLKTFDLLSNQFLSCFLFSHIILSLR
jgi:hypothetical protein